MLLIAIPITLLFQPPEDITVAANLGTQSVKDVLMALAREAIHGTVQNAYRLPPQVILEEAITIITIPAPAIPIPVAPLTIQAPLLLLAPIPQADAAAVGLIGVLVPVKALAATVAGAALTQAIPVKVLAVAEELTWTIQPAAVNILRIMALLVAPADLHLRALIAVLRLEDAAAVGLTVVHALVKLLHRKDVTMCLHPAAEADFIGMLLPVPAVSPAAAPILRLPVAPASNQVLLVPIITGLIREPAPADHLPQVVGRHQPRLQLAARQAAAHVRRDTIGCLTMADGACLTVQPAAVQLTPQHLRLPHQHQLQLLSLRLLKHQLQLHLLQQLKPVLLRHPQANPHHSQPALNRN